MVILNDRDKEMPTQDAREREMEKCMKGLEEKENKLLEDLRKFSEENKKIDGMVNEVGSKLDELEDIAQEIHMQEVYKRVMGA